MRSRTRRSTMFITVGLCLAAVAALSLTGWVAIPAVRADVSPTPTVEPSPTNTPEPTPTNTPEPTPTNTPEPPKDTPTPVPSPPEDTPTPAPTPTIPMVAPEAGATGGPDLLNGLWQVGVGLVLIGIALAWARRRRATKA